MFDYRKTVDVENVHKFKRSSTSPLRTSMRASFRGEIRSSMIHKGSVRSRKSGTLTEDAIV